MSAIEPWCSERMHANCLSYFDLMLFLFEIFEYLLGYVFVYFEEFCDSCFRI